MLKESCAVESCGVTKGLEETLARKRARNMLLKLKIETIKNKLSEFRPDDAEDAARRGAEAWQELDPYNFSDEDYKVFVLKTTVYLSELIRLGQKRMNKN